MGAGGTEGGAGRFRPMTALNLITILVLAFGGLGLFLSSLRGTGADDSKEK
ncbi:MAG: hypothetical protein QM498_12295 [Desulfobacterium sp.]